MRERNYAIDVFRLIAALAVVWCHSEVFIEGNEQVYILITQLLTRFGMPFFFAVTGYFYIEALLNGEASLGKRIKSIIGIYIKWTLVYYVISFYVNVILEGEDISKFLLERVVNFFIKGSYYHLWYIVALVYSLILITIVYKIARERGIQIIAACGVILTILGAFGSVYYPFGSKIPILNILYKSEYFYLIMRWFCMAIPYVSSGYFVMKLKSWKKFSDIRKVWKYWVISLVVYLLEIFFVVFKVGYYDRCELMISVYFLTIMNLLLLLKTTLPQHQNIAKVSKVLSEFLYYSHPLIILGLRKVFELLDISVNSCILFIMVVLCALSISYVVKKKDWYKKASYFSDNMEKG